MQIFLIKNIIMVWKLHVFDTRKLGILKGYSYCSQGIYNLGTEKTMNGASSELRILVQTNWHLL